MNEEPQPVQGDIGATAGELRSRNDELSAVNGRPRDRVELLERAHDDLSNFFASTKVATIFLDERLAIKGFTPAAGTLLGIGEADAGREVAAIDRELLRHGLAIEARRVLEELSASAREMQVRDGRWFTRHVLPYHSQNRRIEGVIVTFTDVTRQREVSDALVRDARRLELAWEAAHGGILEHRLPPDASTHVSAAWANVLGYRLEELPHHTELLAWLSAQVHPEDRDRFDRAFADFADGTSDHFALDVRVRHRQGRWIWVRKVGRVVERDDDGRPVQLLRMMLDITESKEAEAALKESEERFRTMADNISQLAWMADGEGYIFWYNNRWYDYTGTTFEEMKGWGWMAVHHRDHVDGVVEKFRRHLASGEPWEDTFPLRGADGVFRWFLSRAFPVRDAEGRIVRWFGTNTDVTRLRDVEQKLREADRHKDEFLAMLGHELRNPLAAIRSASEVLKFIDGGPTLARTQQILERQAAHMGTIIDGLLDISRIVRGKIDLTLEEIDLAAACAQAVTDATNGLDARELRISTEVPTEPVWVTADRVRLAQILGNLLTNSIKYTPDGGSIGVALRRDGALAEVRITDTGVGIDPELMPHVFEVFRQGAQSMDRAPGGLGLGLPLVKELVRLHGGEVEARSGGAGTGAEFIVRLPVSAKASPASLAPPATSVGARRIVLIEDHQLIAEAMHELLTLAGHEVTTAANGAEGMAAVRASRPDVVLCDLGLPGGMSGYDVARALRSDPALAGVRLVALSGYGQEEDKRQSLEAGFDAHLTKPADLAAIEQVL